MIIISNNQDYNEKYLKPSGYSCFNHMIRSFNFLDQYRIDVDMDSLGLTKDYVVKKKKRTFTPKEMISYDDKSYIADKLNKVRISKELKELKDDSLRNAIDLGNELHACLEALNFNNINLDELDIEQSKKNIIKDLLNHEIFKNISKAKTYHEHEFYYNEYHGIIDLLCIYDDHVDIIDYKLSDISKEEYVRQLNIYKEYVSSKTNKQINCYLLSILRKEIKEI